MGIPHDLSGVAALYPTYKTTRLHVIRALRDSDKRRVSKTHLQDVASTARSYSRQPIPLPFHTPFWYTVLKRTHLEE
ncbi:MAG: hypothetical protein OXM61_02875 [Candidatus Poribacteria bacterium]|nr:hypothetical protein [Candidatus Poribacteria bacterium]